MFKLLPVDNSLIIFESFPDFTDNAWPLYKYLQEKNQYKFVWFVENPNKYKENNTIFINRFRFGLKSVYYLSRCRYYFYTHRLHPYFNPKSNQKVVALWHGAPIKAGKGSTLYYMDYCITTGQGSVDTTAMFLDKSVDIMLPLGYPRNDLLFKSIGPGCHNPFCENTNAKVVVWMPTFRASVSNSLSERQCDTETGLPLLSTSNSVTEFNDFLSKHQIIVVIKIHPLQSEKKIFKQLFSNIVFVTNDDLEKKGIQLYEMIGKSDALLSDYSSIIIDYLITNKPQGFILDDLDSYGNGRGFVYDDIKDFLKGVHIYTISDLYSFLEKVVERGCDDFAPLRAEWSNFMLSSQEDNACENICNYFKI